MIYWFFGFPGIGKDYCAHHLARIGNFPHINADDFLTEDDRQKLLMGTFTVEDRLNKLGRIVSHIKHTSNRLEHIAVADSLPDNASRRYIIDSFEGVKLILVTASAIIHKRRISKRKNHFFTEKLLDSYIEKYWEEIEVPYVEFKNIPTPDWWKRLRDVL